MYNRAGRLYSRGEKKEAEALYKKVRELRGVAIGERHPDTLRVEKTLFDKFPDQNRSKKSGSSHTNASESQRKIPGDKNVDRAERLKSMNSDLQRANKAYDSGLWKRAEELYKKTLETQKEIFGVIHLDTVKSMCRLASISQEQGHYKDAEDMFTEIIQAQKKLHGENHRKTLRSMSQLASILEKQERMTDSKELWERVAAKSERVLGEQDSDTISAY
jgi:tetratricopeptide (TPR) repeat protein